MITKKTPDWLAQTIPHVDLLIDSASKKFVTWKYQTFKTVSSWSWHWYQPIKFYQTISRENLKNLKHVGPGCRAYTWSFCFWLVHIPGAGGYTMFNWNMKYLSATDTVRPLFKNFTQHCETYEPTNCCVKKYTTCVKLYTICVKFYTSCVTFLHNCW